MKKPVVLISNFHPFITRNVFDSGVLEKISQKVGCVIVLVLKHKESFFKERYERNNITVVGIDLLPYISTRREVLVSRIAEMHLDTHTKKLHQQIYRERNGGNLKYLFARTIMATAAHSKVLKTIFRLCVLHVNNTSVFDKYFNELKPEVTICTDPFSPYDTLLMKNARKFNTRLIGYIRSWDNFTTKEYLQVKPDIVIVQNEEMREEAIRYHNLENISCVGIPQYEYFMRYKPKPREQFCKDVGLDSSKKFILFSPAGNKFSSTDWQICEQLKQAQEDGDLPHDIQFLVRPHPMNPTDLSKFVPNENFIIETPISSPVAKESEMDVNDVNHLADSLFHSSVVLNSVSSLIIDAAIFDKPIVTISFDGWEKDLPIGQSVLTEQSIEWLQSLFRRGFTPKAYTKEQMVGYINEYLAHPEKDSDARAQFVRDHCFMLDGKSPDRIVEAIFK